jgi:hypothetical protein
MIVGVERREIMQYFALETGQSFSGKWDCAGGVKC